jgi:hypothetical protein
MNDTLPVLNFQRGNAKLGTNISTFSLPAGHSCPFAKECRSKFELSIGKLVDGKLVDGKHCKFRCYAAMEERYPAVQKSRWHNFNIIKGIKSLDKTARIIFESIHDTNRIRIHTSGDFFSETYFLAWLLVASKLPEIKFYSYTKAIPFLVDHKRFIPKNLTFTSSFGGTHDHLIKTHQLRFAEVVFSEAEAKEKGLKIDHDDSLAYSGKESFALLLHGVQPKKSLAATTWNKLNKSGHGYSMKKRILRKDKYDNELEVAIV